MNRISLLLFTLLLTAASAVWAQTAGEKNDEPIFYRHTLETSPVSPVLQLVNAGIWGVKYDYALTRRDELKVGISWMNIYFPEGNTDSWSLILGYRRYLWRNLYLEYELWPGYDNFYEKNEEKYYPGWDLWNEFRIGYQFRFHIGSLPCFVSAAWPFGFGLYSTNKPDSFYERMNQSFDSKFFYHFPLIFVGAKWGPAS